ncbi:MAG: hypothetical protein KDC95_15475 [Planctomycetes bacterium]|nr:hypothetical protein [Planctomycetota bacterium]
MRLTTTQAAFLLVTWIAAATAGESTTSRATQERKSTIERYRALPAAERSAIARGLRRRLQRDSDPDVQRVLDYELRFAELELATPPVPHDAAVWAKGVAPARRVVRPSDSGWKEARERFPAAVVLKDLERHVDYSWGRGTLVRTAEERIDDDAIFVNIARGYAPGSPDAFVSILQILDAPPRAEADRGGSGTEDTVRTPLKRRQVARWAEHLYADLDARAFADITLWDAWHANDHLDVPDVDAIPFAARVYGETWKSPIPANAARTALYERIRKEMKAYRQARELREVAAATWLTASPHVEGDLSRLVVRMHQLWAACEDDPKRMAARLAEVTDRDALLAELDRAAGRDAKVYEQREERRRRMARLSSKLRLMAKDSLEGH